MQIVSFPASIAVLLFAAIFFLGKFAELHSSPVSSQQVFHNAFNSKESSASKQEMSMEEDNSSTFTNFSTVMLHPWQNIQKSEELMLIEGGDSFTPVACCPTESVMTAPDAGVNKVGEYVTLYHDGEKRQQFWEVSCKPEILEQPCRFMEKRFHNRSRCVQTYAYSYAIIVQPPNTDSYPVKQSDHHFTPSFETRSSSDKYVLDYIRIRSGCRCEIDPNKKYKKSANKGKKKRQEEKKRKHANEPANELE